MLYRKSCHRLLFLYTCVSERMFRYASAHVLKLEDTMPENHEFQHDSYGLPEEMLEEVLAGD